MEFRMKRENLILILGALSIVSVVFSWLQGWLGIQLQYLLLLVGIIAILFVIWHRKESKTLSVEEAYNIALPILKKFRACGDSGAKLRFASRHTDQKRFSSSGKIWDLEFQTGNPSKAVVQIDAKTGKVVNVVLDTEGRTPPIFEKEEPVYIYKPPKMKREVKEEVKPE
jgi:hypothetical protein